MRRGTIKNLFDVIQRIRGRINPDFAIAQLALFLYVAQREGLTMPELSEHLDMPQGTLSRNIKQLSRYSVRLEGGDKEVRGYGLLRTEPDLEERRRLAVYLTKDGRKFIADLERLIMEGES